MQRELRVRGPGACARDEDAQGDLGDLEPLMPAKRKPSRRGLPPAEKQRRRQSERALAQRELRSALLRHTRGLQDLAKLTGVGGPHGADAFWERWRQDQGSADAFWEGRRQGGSGEEELARLNRGGVKE